MKKAAKISVIAALIGFIGAFFVLNLLLPDREFSEQENRYLQQSPVFSLKTLVSGSFMEDFEGYATDQFAFRDWWTGLKARCELISGKKENNGVYYCEGGALISRFDAPEDHVISENISYLNALAENAAVPVYFALIPGAAQVQAYKLPVNAPNDSEQAVIDAAYAGSAALNVDMLSLLSAHASEYIFYRTDHHWTSLGAFYGYNALRAAWGLDAADIDDYERQIVSDSFYGTTCSSSGFSWVAPDEIEIFVPDDGSAAVTGYAASSPQVTGLYDESCLDEKDKYSFFLGGNAPRLTVRTGNADKPKLCIVRDSYTDCLLPFLLDDFSQIDLIDLRYYKDSLSDYIGGGAFDMVLVIYSVANFCEDTNLFLLGM